MEITPSQLVPEELNEKEFRPQRYWISGNVQDQAVKIRNQLVTIQPGIFSTPDFGDVRNIHICSVDEVVSHFGTKIYMITPSYLNQLIEKDIGGFNLTDKARQRISLYLYNMRIAITGVESQEFISLHNKLILNGATPVHPSNISQMNMIASSKVLDKYVLNAISHGITAVSPDFISMSYLLQKDIPVNDYILKNFTNITVTTSDLDPSTNKNLKALVVDGNGKWNDCLDDSVDFVIAERLAITKKIKIALENKIPIVKVDWIKDHSQKPTSVMPYVINFWSVGESFDVFHGNTFKLDQKCEDPQLLMDAIRESNGKFDVNESYVVVPNFSKKIKNSVTQHWIWACINQKQIILLDSSVMFTPFGYESYTKELEGVGIIVLNLEKETNEVIDILKLFGAVIRRKIVNGAKYMICLPTNSKDFQKDLKRAHKKGAKIYHPQWVYELASTGKIPKNIKEIPSDTSKNFQNIVSSIINTKRVIKPSQMEKSASKNLDEYESEDETDDSDNDITYHTPSHVSKKKKSKDDQLMKILGGED
ncbi:hypothetical protein TVAG_370570 [Trichomonas vaginalis G3]|uniref:BRCT domain-containing protein n=1 Tax=Trichomonas vaginalis (strain ATCC PRA-98 / G3) TaxID=412133 RepID=A2FJQ4_TRIV3|nr:protein localization to site of double-strand break [Trichomonas vaginalis G3]EAX94886.1 hypothetical protein TVAG_370570 [Trichomonas vaginalis G3]KAI5541490.1 protein localization to site of double-strand break [Trichomonas vaginalis G3]|eukprot:XP_001307816.1 hypothetical protein [Trichomonas vaginalis G3]